MSRIPILSKADAWADTRINIFFPAHNQTPADGNLTGQCVTLLKWFFQDCTTIPGPFTARGDARYVGRNLVAQGHAYEVPYAERRAGDVVCMEYGTYGHIYLQLSEDRTFEQNVNIGGVQRRVLSDGTVVYSSRIGNGNEAFRNNNRHVYRIKSYKEEGLEMKIGTDIGYDAVNRIHHQVVGNWDVSKAYWDSIQGKDFASWVLEMSNHPNANNATSWQVVGENAARDRWDLQIYALQKGLADANTALTAARQQIEDLGSRPTKAELEKVTSQLQEAENKATKAQADLEVVLAERAKDQETGNSFLRWLGGILGKSK